MRNLLLIIALVFSVAAFAVNGSIENIGEIKVVNLWGTWSEMGYAHGYLLAPDLIDMYEGYFLELAGGVSNVELLRTYFPLYFDIPPEFSQYAAGIIQGAEDSLSLWSPVYNRNIDTLDIYITSAVPDLSSVVDFPMLLCSSASAWGDATLSDPVLQGSPAISRNLDYYVDSNESILNKSMLFVYDPADGQDWISISFPGFMGSLSGMNESGLNAALNMGNYSGTSQTNPVFVPICIALTLGLSQWDFDESGSCDINDMKAASTFWNRSNTYDIHITAPVSLSAGGDPAVVTEVNNHIGYEFRYSSDEPSIYPGHLLLTNHHRVLYPPVSCYRYSRMMDSLSANPDVTLERLWNFMSAVGEVPVPGLGGTLQTMIFMPEERRTGVAFASSGIAPYSNPPEWIEWDDIYPNHDPQGIQVSPGSIGGVSLSRNPVSGILTVSASVRNPGDIRMYDLSGRLMQVSFTPVTEGVYSADISHLQPSACILTAGESSHAETAVVVIITN